MENRGTGLRPQRPAGWEKAAMVGLNHPSPQGAAVEGHVTSRSMQAPIPGEVITQIGQSPGGFLGQIVAGRPGMQVERSMPGDGTNQSAPGGNPSGFPHAGEGQGGGMTTKGGVSGQANGGAHFGAGPGAF